MVPFHTSHLLLVNPESRSTCSDIQVQICAIISNPLDVYTTPVVSRVLCLQLCHGNSEDMMGGVIGD
uniref:Uncharacterized protein n=1 Tax=Anguilla anguilla TaxID=7936 RepID=A0A0E9UHL3_ANGAN